MATGLTVIKKFTYRGDTNEEYANQYWFRGATPSDSTAWRALFDLVVAQEKTLYVSGVTVVRGYGYDDPSPTANNVWSVDMTASPNTPVAGTYAPTGVRLPGDAAVWIGWRVSNRLSEKGKPIWLRKYYHPAYIDSNAYEVPLASWVTAAGAFATKMRDGTLATDRTLTDRNHLDTIAAHKVGPYVTTRTLKRRGKRPNPTTP